jgi:hypothetical protein
MSRSFPRVKRPMRGVDQPPTPSAEVKERVELYLYSPSEPSCPVIGWNLPLFELVQENCFWFVSETKSDIFNIIFTLVYPVMNYLILFFFIKTGGSKIVCKPSKQITTLAPQPTVHFGTFLCLCPPLAKQRCLPVALFFLILHKLRTKISI